MRLYAPAKINWTLEALRRREDGYHEVRTVMQTVEPCDVLDLARDPGLEMEVEGAHSLTEDDLVLRAAAALACDEGWGARIHVQKRIPVSAGLGGGSSDAAAALRGFNELWGLGHSVEELAEMAARLGSDVPFFLRGGTALCEGRGERVTPLPEAPPAWLALVVPPVEMRSGTEGKTRRMYAALRPEDFSDGSRTEALVGRLRAGQPVRDEDAFNAFERAAYEVFDGLAAYRDALLAAGARRAQVAGSGPALFALCESEEEARAIAGRLSASCQGESPLEAMAVRTLSSAEATRLEA